MSLENKNMEEEFINGLRLIIKQGYSPEKTANYAYGFYLKYANKIEGKFYKTLYNIMMMDAGPEFEMTKDEIINLIKDRLKVDL
jgi:hypothetical protein